MADLNLFRRSIRLKKKFLIFMVLSFVFLVGCFNKKTDPWVDVSGKYDGELTVTKLESVEENGWLGYRAKVSFLVTQENETMTLTFIEDQEEENEIHSLESFEASEEEKEIQERDDDTLDRQNENLDQENLDYEMILGETFTGRYDFKEGVFTYNYAQNAILTVKFVDESDGLWAKGALVFRNEEKDSEDEITIELRRVQSLN
jgi:hypothetical protein